MLVNIGANCFIQKQLTQHQANLSLVAVLWASIMGLASSSVQANGPEDRFYGPLPNWVSVTQFGANGADSADDTQAIQSAINALIQQATGTCILPPGAPQPCTPWATLYIPSGTYYVTGLHTDAQNSVATDNAVQGINLIGEDPSNTKLVYIGSSGGTMLRWTAGYDKVARLSFDGAGLATKGIFRENSRFSTNSEMSDLSFSNIAKINDKGGECIQLGNNVKGAAEISILRSRFYDCKRGIRLFDANTLDIYIWNSFFQGNEIAIDGEAGAFHAYDNYFWASTNSDFRANHFVSTMTQNISLNSNRFFKGTNSNPTMLRNQVFTPFEMPIAIAGSDDDAQLFVNGLTMIDNVFKLRPDTPLLQLKSYGDLGQTQAASLLSGNHIETKFEWPVEVFVLPDSHQHQSDFTHVTKLAIDNDPNTFSLTNFKDHNKAGIQWIAPFGSRPKASSYQVVLSNEPNYPAQFYRPESASLYASNDWGATWTLLDAQMLPATSQLEFTFPIPVNKQGNYAIYELRLSRAGDNGYPNVVPLAEFRLWENNINIARDPRAQVIPPRAGWGKFAMDSQYLYPIGTITAPTSLEPYPFQARDDRDSMFIEPQPSVGSICPTGAAIQAAINQTIDTDALGVYLRKCAYPLTQTVEIPATFNKVLLGEGANASATQLFAVPDFVQPNNFANTVGSADKPPLIKMVGDSFAVLRDFYLNAGQCNSCANAIEILGGGADIEMDQVIAAASAVPKLASAAFRIEAPRNVRMRSFGMGSYDRGVVVSNGAKVQIFSGGTGNGMRSYEVDGDTSSILAYGIWQDDTHASTPYVNPLVDVTDSRGTLSLVANAFNTTFSRLGPYQGKSIVGKSFAGRLALIGNRFESCGSFDVSITGTAFQAFAGAQSFRYGVCDRVPSWQVQASNPSPPSYGWDFGGVQIGMQELPSSQYAASENSAISLQPCIRPPLEPQNICRGTMPNDLNGQQYAYPSIGAMSLALEHLRTLSTEPPDSKDLRLSRLYISIGQGLEGVMVRE
jgi:Pectate lyase superfamily protein